MQRKKVAILGSCISRDIFNKDEDSFELVESYNFCSLISQQLKALECKVSVEEIGHKSNWFSRMITADLNKSCIENIAMKKPEYLVIDLMTERLNIIKCNFRGEDVWLTSHDGLKETKLFETNELTLEAENHLKWERLSAADKEKYVRNYCNKILEVMPPERIIFVETYMVPQYISKSGGVHMFDKQQQRINMVNARLLEIENLMLFYLGACNVIKLPYNQLADENHHLKLSPMHYTENYYKYAYESIKRICRGSYERCLDLYDMATDFNDELIEISQRIKN